jgi:hypothetical protein
MPAPTVQPSQTLNGTQPLSSKVYHVGHLAADRYSIPSISGKSKEESNQIDDKANLYWRLYRSNQGFLTQRCVGDGMFEYIYTAKKK